MKSWKKTGIIAGHIVCILIVVLCVVYGQVRGRKESQESATLGSSVKVDSAEPTEILLEPEVTEPTETPPELEVTEPTETPTEPEVTEPTEIPSEPEVTEPTETPTEPEVTEPTEIPSEPEVTEPTEIPPEPEVTEPTETPTEPEVTEPTETPTEPEVTEPTELPEGDLSGREAVKQQVLANIKDGVYQEFPNARDGWWYYKNKNHDQPKSGQSFDVSKYQGYYVNKEVEDGDKVIYLTMDCGYGSANAPKMMDIFKKHDIKITFFVTKFFIDANPDYVRRMVEEGHAVGNHSVSHIDLVRSTDEKIYDEIIGCEEAFYNVTGQQMDLYFRPPEGLYSERTMKMTEDLGYKTIFWSIAYNDYDKNNQPGKDFVIDFFTTYHHNGAIPLMHNDSMSNLEAMDEVLTLLKEQGYRFGTLDELK